MKLPEPVHHECGQYTVHLLPGEDGILAELGASLRVDEYERYLPSVTTEEGQLPHINLSGGPFVEELVDLLQYVESIGSFWLELRKVGWEDPTFEWIPESQEEESQLQVRSFSQRYGFAEPTREYDPRYLQETLRDRESRAHLVVPLAFYREGMNEHAELRFIQAFFNFYFFLEGLFGGGKTKNYHVERSFLSSEQLVAACAEALKSIEDFRPRRDHYAVLKQWLGDRGLEWSPEGVLRLLVRMRGELHHFTAKHRTRSGHPLNQRRYETLSFLAMTICVNNVVRFLGPDTVDERTGRGA